MEQRYQAVLAVIADGRGVGEVAAQFGVSRQSVHAWLGRYEDHGLEALANRSHKPKSIPHQMPATVEAAVLELRREHRSWGPRRLVYELLRRGVEPVPSETGVYRAVKRAGLIEPGGRRRRKDTWKRWERGSAMELWQMDIVGGFALRDGTFAKCLTGVDDHSRLCVSAKLMRRELSRSVCDGLEQALARFGVPGQILTDNGKVFTGKHFRPPVEVLFEKICRENGIDTILTAPYSPTTTGKIERFHRSLRAEFLTGRVFDSLHHAQRELDAWVEDYNQSRPHQALGMKTPLEAFTASQVAFRRAPGLFWRVHRLARFVTLAVVREAEVSTPQNLKAYGSFPVARAWWTDGQLENLSDEVSDSTHFYHFRDVALSANRRGGFLRSGRSLIVPGNGLPGPSRLYFAGSGVAGIVEQVDSYVLAERVSKSHRVERGIFAGSMAPHNWFHWIIDTLPTLYQARFLPNEFDGYPLLVPAAAKKRPNWLAALDIVSGGREIVFVEGDRWFQIDDLVRIEGVTRPNPRPLLSRQRARVGVMTAPLLDYQNFVLTELQLRLVPVVPGRRLFIGRKTSGPRVYNQEEVFAVAEGFGFERVFLEDLTFEDSIRVFREAELIAGPHGAGWANMLFCHPSTKAMLWTWEGEEEDNWYENIAYVAGLDYLQLRVPLVDDEGVDKRVAGYHLDRSALEDGLRALLAGPSATTRSRLGARTGLPPGDSGFTGP